MIIKKKMGCILLTGLLTLNLIGINNINVNATNNSELKLSNINSFGGSDEENLDCGIVTSDGGLISVGYSKSTDINGIAINGTSDAVIVKYNKYGKEEWIKNFGGNNEDAFNSVTETSDGGFIAVGYSNSTNIADITNKGYEDAIVVKYDKTGNQEWVKSFGGDDKDEFNSVINTSDGGFAVVGVTHSFNIDGISNKGLSEAIIVKYNSSGNQEWVKGFGGSGIDIFNSVVENADGSFVTAGYSYSMDIEGIDNTGGNEYAVICKYDKTGTQEWVETIMGNNSDCFNSLTTTSDGGVIVVGYSMSTDVLDFMNNGSSDAIIAKYDSSGYREWIQSFGGSKWDLFNSVAETPDGGFICVGETMSSDIEGVTNKGGKDAIVVKYNNTGTQEWAESFGGIENDYFEFIANTISGGIAIVGDSMSTDIEGISNKGNYDGIILYYNDSLTESDSSTGTLTSSSDLNVQVVADNSLEMSLSTNQISFTGYNGIEDLINNDLNITVSSGLNYDLFAKLNSEIKGTNDIEAIIDKSNLKIKTLDDLEYKEFTTIGTPIKLVDNAPNGKNKVHNINFKLLADSSVKADTYNTSITFEATQK